MNEASSQGRWEDWDSASHALWQSWFRPFPPSTNASFERGFFIQIPGLKPAGGAGRRGGGNSAMPSGLPGCSVARDVRRLPELKAEPRGRQKSWLETHSGQFGQAKEQRGKTVRGTPKG